MADSHDEAARRIVRKLGGQYDPKSSPDVTRGRARVEVKSTADEITEALRQLGGGTGLGYVALPKPEHKKALERLQGLKTGLMDHDGNIVKSSSRKRSK